MTDNTFTLTKGERTKGQPTIHKHYTENLRSGNTNNQLKLVYSSKRSTNITQKTKNRATRTISLNWSTATNDPQTLHRKLKIGQHEQSA
jgi:hypothetical protein